MQQLLRGLEHCHSRGVLHRDIKGSNLLVDSNGILQIADFGLSTLFHPDNRQPLTSRVVTLWYRPPELLLGATYYGVAVDLWSVGCILAELLAGKPIMPGRTEVPLSSYYYFLNFMLLWVTFKWTSWHNTGTWARNYTQVGHTSPPDWTLPEILPGCSKTGSIYVS